MKNLLKWVEALESGSWEQCYCALRIKDCFCVLGVAMEIYYQETGRYTPVPSPFSDRINYGSFRTTLPDDVLKWLGISYHESLQYSVLNDVDEMSFAEIARKIRKDHGLPLPEM